MADTCWYNRKEIINMYNDVCSKRICLDDGRNNNLNGPSVKENNKWSCSGDTSLVEPEILEDMGVGMLADGEASRESLQALATQECTLSPKNFEEKKKLKNGHNIYEKKETFNNEQFESTDRLENENCIEVNKKCIKEDSNDATGDKTGIDPFFLFRRKRKLSVIGEDKFNKLSDEMILMILKWLPKKCLVRSMLVCKRWYQIACDEALWTRLDLGGKVLNEGTLGHILPRGVQILRMAQTEIIHPVFLPNNNDVNFEKFVCKLQYLDLSMAVISAEDLSDILTKCKYLKKLSLEKCALNQVSCRAMSNNEDLEVLNLTMCEGMDIDCVKDLTKLTRLTSLNVAWCGLDSECMSYLCCSLPLSVTRLNIAGCRKTLTDTNLKDLVQCCPYLVELDLSDCTLLTINTVQSLMRLSKLEHLSLSRCYSIPMQMHIRLSLMPRLMFLDIFGLMSEDLLRTFQANCGNLQINKCLYSAVARPTVGLKRTSIWELRVRDYY